LVLSTYFFDFGNFKNAITEANAPKPSIQKNSATCTLPTTDINPKKTK